MKRPLFIKTSASIRVHLRLIEPRIKPAASDQYFIDDVSKNIRQPIIAPLEFESQALVGIQKNVPLHVSVLAIDEKGTELDQYKTQYISDVDQDTLPTKPLMNPNKPGYVPQLENLK